MSLADMTSARSSPAPETCPDCDTSASITSDLHKYQVACTCKAPSAQYACAEEPGPPAPAKTGDVPPALPPRPAAALAATNRRNNAALPNAAGAPAADGVLSCTRRRKYAWWCVGCGALAAALGGLLAAAHILLRAYTASPHHLETVPAAVPAAMLVLTGVCIMSLARRRNRYSYMIKVVGACCLVCALTCVLVTITTTVIHMNKLQTLKFCEYTKLTRTCTCFSLPPDTHHSGEEDEGVRCVFEGVSDCGVVHGVLYWCLRGVFALSVAAVLVCIFSSMLAYQLLSHERKKMYWEQLELRCRSLYRPPAGAPTPRARPVQAPCACCRQCHPQQPAWDISLQHRFWAPGRIGNLYSPNPGTMRKTSAWSWFPWPRTNSERCRMGAVPQSGDSAYGFCDTSGENPTQTQPNPDPPVPYEDRPSYPANYTPSATFNQTLPFNNVAFARNLGQTANFSQSTANFSQAAGFGQGSSGFGQTAGFVQASAGFGQASTGFGQASAGYGQESSGFGEASGSFEAQNGVWGPPPPYSPQGKGGSRHHLHQDPATTTLLHHHHIEMHRNSMPVHSHDHTLASSLVMQPHTCSARSSSYMGHLIHPNAQITADISHFGQDMANLGPNRDMSHFGPDMANLGPDRDMTLGPDGRNDMCLQEMGRYPRGAALEAELVHLQSEMARLGSEAARCNTLRGHLVPYNGCQRMMGVSMGNLHRDCGRMQDESLTVECLRQSGGGKDQSIDSSKQGKENLAFQSDKHSPVRSSLQLDCRGNQQAESEVYFADVSSCCNVSVKADCCGNPNVSALVGTIENHPESTSGESDSGSFTLTRQQRPQPQTLGSKRRPRLPPNNDKPRLADLNCSARSQDVREAATNASLREQFSRQDVSRDSATNSSLREHFNRQDGSRDSATNASLREQFNRQDVRDSATNASLREQFNRQDARDCATNACLREQFNRQDSRDCAANSSLREQFNRQDARDSATNGSLREQFNRQEQMNNSIREQLNNSLRHSEHNSPIRMCENANLNELNNSMRQHHGSPLHKTIRNDLNATIQDRRMSDQLNNSIRLEKNLEQLNSSIRLEKNLDLDDARMRNLDHSILDDSRMRNSPKIKNQNHHMSPGLRKTQNHRSSPKNPLRESPLHARQSSSDSTVSHKNNPEFFVPPPPAHSPLSPGTEESLISDEELERSAEIFKKTEGDILALGPDSQYEPVREVKNEEFKPNHHHCYSDTNTMDSGWQSGSEKHATD